MDPKTGGMRSLDDAPSHQLMKRMPCATAQALRVFERAIRSRSTDERAGHSSRCERLKEFGNEGGDQQSMAGPQLAHELQKSLTQDLASNRPFKLEIDSYMLRDQSHGLRHKKNSLSGKTRVEP